MWVDLFGLKWSNLVLRGSISAKIDAKGRLKVPTTFRSAIAEKYGELLYVTSITGQSVLIFPMSVWVEREEKLKDLPSTLPAIRRYVDHVNYYGQQADFDKQGRVSIHGRVRVSAEMTGDVDVFGKYDHLEVWNHGRFLTQLKKEPFTDDDANALADFGI